MMTKPRACEFSGESGGKTAEFTRGNQFMLCMLKRTPFFYDLTEEEFCKISRQIVVHKLKPGEAIVLEKERGDSMFFVSEGSLRSTILNPDTGESVLLNQLARGSFFGEVSLLTGRLNPVSVTALSACEVMEIPGAVYKKAAFRYPAVRGFLIGLYRQYSSRVGRTLKSNCVNRRKLDRAAVEGNIVFQQFEPGSKEKIIKVGNGRLIDISETGASFYMDRRQVTCRLPEMLNREYKAKITVGDSFSLKVLGKIVGFEFRVTGRKFYDLYIARMAFTLVDRKDKTGLKEFIRFC